MYQCVIETQVGSRESILPNIIFTRFPILDVKTGKIMRLHVKKSLVGSAPD